MPLRTDVRETPGPRKSELPAVIPPVVDVFEDRLGLSGQREAVKVERRRVQHVMEDPDQMPAGKVAGEESAAVKQGPLSSL